MSAGTHTPKVWMVDPGVVLQSFVLDAGGLCPRAAAIYPCSADRVVPSEATRPPVPPEIVKMEGRPWRRPSCKGDLQRSSCLDCLSNRVRKLRFFVKLK
ncbi:hypothetical protein IEN85_13120 [Pelagicoccus sp. NFK12]|uniref:Gylcosyl hydrolase 115 C-terminal domain-containing protein n=1 Tax=Pelagicoccus enzymogenes TaxID=2773457 RepID=A0A927IIF4_9BACT|nr:hypothetical protein [Pelagicoccus enzymogenes]